MVVLELIAMSQVYCSNSTIEGAAKMALDAIRTNGFECVRQNIEDPEMKFPGGEISPAVADGLVFRTGGKKSYRDIARQPVYTHIEQQGGSAMAFYMVRSQKDYLLKSRANLNDDTYMKYYFTCAFVHVGGKWILTRDFCNTEGGY